MSVSVLTSMASPWPPSRNRSQSSAPLESRIQQDVNFCYSPIPTSTFDERPPLRSHKSVPYTLGSLRHAPTHTQSPLSQVAQPLSHAETQSGDRPEPLKLSDESRPPPQRILVKSDSSRNESCPASPASRISPTTPDFVEDEQFEDEYEMQDVTEGDEDKTDSSVTKSAAERRADKRKMKRFRLTHNQTRFLMSEFARQAHPDAAQRERLSREIPGLSPRQVQVWFQNR